MTVIKETEHRLLLDMPQGRYDIVALTWAWLNVFQKSDDAKGMSPSEIVKRSLDDVMSGAITMEDVKKAKTRSSHAAQAEEKPVEIEEVKKKNAKSKK